MDSQGDWDIEWDCDCDSNPPPTFFLPPPPRPPPPPEEMLLQEGWKKENEGCDAPWTCPALLEAREDLLSPLSPPTPLGAVIISGATLVLHVIITAFILYR